MKGKKILTLGAALALILATAVVFTACNNDPAPSSSTPDPDPESSSSEEVVDPVDPVDPDPEPDDASEPETEADPGEGEPDPDPAANDPVEPVTGGDEVEPAPAPETSEPGAPAGQGVASTLPEGYVEYHFYTFQQSGFQDGKSAFFVSVDDSSTKTVSENDVLSMAQKVAANFNLSGMVFNFYPEGTASDTTAAPSAVVEINNGQMTLVSFGF